MVLKYFTLPYGNNSSTNVAYVILFLNFKIDPQKRHRGLGYEYCVALYFSWRHCVIYVHIGMHVSFDNCFVGGCWHF
jgi:hypothetical protein